MHWTNIGLILVAGLDLGMALLIWLRNPKNKINISFALAFILAAVWTFGVSLFREATSERSLIIWGWISDLAGAMSLIPLFFFSQYYPYQRRILSVWQRLFILISIVIVSTIVFVPDAWFGKPYYIDPPHSGYTLKLSYWFFVSYYTLFVLWIFLNLLSKYKKSSGFARFQLGIILIGLGFVNTTAGLMSVFWPALHNSWRYWHWVGPYSTMATLAAIGYFLFFSQRKA